MAPALLGSILLANEEKHESLKPSSASCGNGDIDSGVLEGGLRYGEITAISGASGTGKTTFAFQAIASHLIAHEEGQVALVATTDPSLARLRDILIARLSRNDRGPVLEESGYVYQKQHSAVISTQDIMIQVTSMLERVRISRVFDFPGVAEALSEFSVSFKGEGKANEEKADESEHDRVRSIADSEDDLVADLETQRPGTASTTKDEDSGVKILPASMFVVDNIANVVGSTMAKSQVQGHAFLASFIRSLQHWTRRRHMCTLILNAAVGLHPQNTQHHRRPDDQVSIFASVSGKPALGKHFSYLIDTSIFLFTLPRSKDDADTAYGDAGDSKRFGEVGLIEVLKDRHGGREGRWGAFTVKRGTELQNVRL